MFEELGISFGTALIVLLALYFIVKWGGQKWNKRSL